MNIIKNMILFLKNIFKKQENVKTLEAYKQDVSENKEADFIQALKITNADKGKKKEIETLICEGNGLGIQKKISF